MPGFRGTASAFESFLRETKDADSSRSTGTNNERFIAENFLIEEQLDPFRIQSYTAELPIFHGNEFAAWNRVHNEYLRRHVFSNPPAAHDYRVVPRNDVNICPETFRAEVALKTFEGTDLDTAFIRIVPVDDLAWMARRDSDYMFSTASRALVDFHRSNPAYRELDALLDLAFTGPHCDRRPVFATLYEDCIEELRDPADDSWANVLRDRLGLYHINQWLPGGLPRNVFLFKYTAREVPRFAGAVEASRRPIAVPVVLDHRLFGAFCPAPRELDRGRLVNLDSTSRPEPAREILHLFMPLTVEHLYRVGTVTTPVPEDLATVRNEHMFWLRLLSDRDDYGLL